MAYSGTLPSPPSSPRGILKGTPRSSFDYDSSPPPPSCRPSITRPRKKSAQFDDVARCIITGNEIVPSNMTGSEYRAWHKGYKQEAGRALLVARVESMFDEFVKRVERRM